ncbi:MULTISPECIES: phosphatase PAP2 family protein [unclassified Roseovarius]|uniref:phosphatase PAP2 family protein n=1 Tax=unclassified Roseovarius TaxID=2614913 RepID=UPI00273DF9F9|nr:MULTISPECIES: phosphatase PAP2 family protein [unclassified Roseovarius]
MQTELLSGQAPISQRKASSVIGAALRQNSILCGLVATYFLAAIILSTAISVPLFAGRLSSSFWMLLGLVPIFLLSMVIWRFAHMVAHVRPTRPIGWLIRDLRDLLITDRARLASGAIAILGIVFFAVIFSYVKEAIPLLNPFAWDEAFAELDRLVHGGVDPYRLLLPALGNAAMFQIADLTYSTWFLLIYFFGFLAAMDRENPDRRNTFLFAFILSWIIGGSILATLFSSVGPIYFQAFGFGDQFLPLKDMLMRINAETPLVAVELQAMLLDGYQNSGGLGGISAMPSMHLATSWLMAFQAFRYTRALGWTMVAFAIMIQVSSVLLGWHYAIDGYFGFLVALVCWICGAGLARLQARINRPVAP